MEPQGRGGKGDGGGREKGKRGERREKGGKREGWDPQLQQRGCAPVCSTSFEKFQIWQHVASYTKYNFKKSYRNWQKNETFLVVLPNGCWVHCHNSCSHACMKTPSPFINGTTNDAKRVGNAASIALLCRREWWTRSCSDGGPYLVGEATVVTLVLCSARRTLLLNV